jgi:DNA-binding response OmpR family regulator
MGALAGQLVLVVEDDPLVAMGVSEALTDAGAEVILAHDLHTALETAKHSAISAAILDVALGDGDSGTVCAALKSRQVPFMFLTGFDTHDTLREWAAIPALAKPTGEVELVTNVAALVTC